MFSVSTLKSQKGSALWLALGLMLLIGAIAAGIWSRSQANLRYSQQATLKDEADLIIEAFASRLQNPETCSDVLAGEFVAPGSAADVMLRYVLDESVDPEAKALGAGSKVTGALNLVHLKVEVPADEDMRTEILDENNVPVALHRYPAYLQATFADEKGALIHINRTIRTRADGSKEMDLGIPFYVWTNAADGQILSCFGRNSAGTMCNETGGYFIPHTEPYHLSCRHSFKTERRKGGHYVAHGNCRLGGFKSKPKECAKLFDVPFVSDQVQQTHSRLAPGMPNQFLCQLCM